MVLEKKIFLKFFPIMSMELQANDPQVLVNLDPMGMVGRTYVVDHKTLLYSDYIKAVSLMDSEIFKF